MNLADLDAKIRYFKVDGKTVALLTLQTSSGPVSLAASADADAIAKVLTQSKQALSGSSYIIVDESTTRRAAELAQQIAKEGLMGKLADATSNAPNDKAAAASRLYVRLTQKDTTAWNAVRQLIAQAKAGDESAMLAWKLLLQAHARSASNGPHLGTGSGTLEQQRAASRIYDRLQQGDATAWQDLAQIAMNAEAGDTKSIQAWSILASVHEGRSRGMLVGASSRLHPTAVAQLTRMAKAALASRPARQLIAGQHGWTSVTPRLAVPSPPPNRWLYVTAPGGLNLHWPAGGEIVDVLPYGSEVKQAGSLQDGWLSVTRREGSRGYVHSAHLSRTKPNMAEMMRNAQARRSGALGPAIGEHWSPHSTSSILLQSPNVGYRFPAG